MTLRSSSPVILLLALGCGPRTASDGGSGSESSQASESSSDSSDESETGPREDLPGSSDQSWDPPPPVTDCGCDEGEVCLIEWSDGGCNVYCRLLPASCGDAPSCDGACNWDLCEHVQCNGQQQLDDDCDLTHYTVTGWVCHQSMSCNPWLDNCPEAEGCHPYAPSGSWWTSTKCYAPGNDVATVGEPCLNEGGPFSGQDNCVDHAICWDVDPNSGVGTCISLCSNAPHDPSCPPGTACVFADVMQAAFCLPACDPFADPCTPGYHCTKVDDKLACMPDAGLGLGLGLPCSYPNACEAGLACIDGECTALCDLNAPVCPPETPTCIDAQTNVAHVGVCTP